MIIKFSKKAQKDLDKVPEHVQRKMLDWLDSITEKGLAGTRKVKGWHDEPLKGERKGQRSVRLNISYRAIYVEETGEILEVIEVNRHKY